MKNIMTVNQGELIDTFMSVKRGGCVVYSEVSKKDEVQHKDRHKDEIFLIRHKSYKLTCRFYYLPSFRL